MSMAILLFHLLIRVEVSRYVELFCLPQSCQIKYLTLTEYINFKKIVGIFRLEIYLINFILCFESQKGNVK